MEEKHLFLLALFTSLFGLSLLSFIYLNAEWQEGGILEGEIGNKIALSGVVKEVNSRGNVTFLVLQREVEVVVFEEVFYPVGREVVVVGEVEEFNGKVELIASSIATQ